MKNSIKKKKLKNGDVKYTVTFMYKGVRYKKTFPTAEECEMYKSEIKRYVDMFSRPYIECNKPLSQVIDEWFEQKSATVSEGTRVTYLSMIKKVKNHPSHIAKAKIRELDYGRLQKFFDSLCASNGKPTCSLVKHILHMTYVYAQRSNYVESNPVSLCELRFKESKQPKKTEDTTVTLDELQTIVDELQRVGNYDFVSQALTVLCYIMFFTGARISEALCLEKGDFDFENHTVTFDKQLSKHKASEMKPVELKTEASYATIPIPETLESILKDWFSVNPYETVICDQNGKYLSYHRWFSRIRKVRDNLGISFHAHQLRHSYGSHLVMENVNIKSVQSMMRHSSVSTTMDTYVTSNLDKEKTEVDRVFDSFSNGFAPKLHQAEVN